MMLPTRLSLLIAAAFAGAAVPRHVFAAGAGCGLEPIDPVREFGADLSQTIMRNVVRNGFIAGAIAAFAPIGITGAVTVFAGLTIYNSVLPAMGRGAGRALAYIDGGIRAL